jgi:hypothetical protein
MRVECKYVSKVSQYYWSLIVVKTSESYKAKEMLRRSVSIFATGRLEMTPLGYPRLGVWWQ